MAKNSISSDNYLRITDTNYFVGNENTRYYQDELVLCRDYMHTKEIANLRKKHPNLTAIHCMISKTNCNWCNPKYGEAMGNKVLRYNLRNPSVEPGVYQWVRAELCNTHFTPWYYSGVCVDDSIFKIDYTINSLGDKCILTATADEEFSNMLNFFDGAPAQIECNITRWIEDIKARKKGLRLAQRTK